MTTTEAENLARRLHDSHGGQSCAAIDMIREQAAEIERLTTCLKKANDQGEHFEREWYLRGDAIERKASEIERLTAELGDLPEAQAMLLSDCKRKDALLRRALAVICWKCFGECWMRGVADLPTASEIEAEIKTELGEI